LGELGSYALRIFGLEREEVIEEWKKNYVSGLRSALIAQLTQIPRPTVTRTVPKI
jgi:hypothetical protein